MNDEFAQQTALAARVLKGDMEAIWRAMLADQIVIRLTDSQAAMVKESLRFSMEKFRAYPYPDEQTRRERMAEARAILAAIRDAQADARDEARGR